MISLNYFEEKCIKHVRSVILQIKRVGKIDQNAYILRYKVKIKEIMFSWKETCNFAGEAELFTLFSETNEITPYWDIFFQAIKNTWKRV